MFSREELTILKRKNIQALAKQHSIKANGKTSDIISQLLALDAKQETVRETKQSESLPKRQAFLDSSLLKQQVGPEDKKPRLEAKLDPGFCLDLGVWRVLLENMAAELFSEQRSLLSDAFVQSLGFGLARSLQVFVAHLRACPENEFEVLESRLSAALLYVMGADKYGGTNHLAKGALGEMKKVATKGNSAHVKMLLPEVLHTN